MIRVFFRRIWYGLGTVHWALYQQQQLNNTTMARRSNKMSSAFFIHEQKDQL